MRSEQPDAMPQIQGVETMIRRINRSLVSFTAFGKARLGGDGSWEPIPGPRPLLSSFIAPQSLLSSALHAHFFCCARLRTVLLHSFIFWASRRSPTLLVSSYFPHLLALPLSLVRFAIPHSPSFFVAFIRIPLSSLTSLLRYFYCAL